MLAAKETAELDNLIGDIDVEAGDRRAAAVGYQRAAHLEPTEDHLFDWGDNLLHLGAHGDAVDVFAAGIRRHPDVVAAAHRPRHRAVLARPARGRGAIVLPRRRPRARRSAPVRGSSARCTASRPEQSGEITRRLARFVERYPDRAYGHFYYAMSLWKGVGEVDLARVEAQLRRAVALDGEHAKARLQLGILLSEQRRWAEAIPELQRAVALAPEQPQGHFRLAHAYRRNGQTALADEELAIFERLKAREPADAPPPVPE